MGISPAVSPFVYARTFDGSRAKLLFRSGMVSAR